MMIYLLASLSIAHADIQQSECLRPKNNPQAKVGIIYLHGLFPAGKPNDDNRWMVTLEQNNRKKLQELADKLGVTIAVPASKTVSKMGTRRWPVEDSPENLLKELEATSRAVCGRLDEPRSILGFSNGGYLARELALRCLARKPTYDLVMMSGAKARNGSKKGREKCARLVGVRGTKDTKDGMDGFEASAAAMMDSIGGTGQTLRPFPGGHELPPLDLLAQQLNSTVPPVAIKPSQITPTGGFLIPDESEAQK